MGILYTIHCHSPGGDTAASVGNKAFYATHAHSLHNALAEFALSWVLLFSNVIIIHLCSGWKDVHTDSSEAFTPYSRDVRKTEIMFVFGLKKRTEQIDIHSDGFVSDKNCMQSAIHIKSD